MMEYKTGPLSLSKSSIVNAYNIQSNSLLQYLEYNLNKRTPDHQYIYTPKIKSEEEYQQKWQHQFLRQLQEELNSDQPTVSYYRRDTEIEYRGDKLSREIHLGAGQKASSKYKRKEFEKYKAYAVKLKIPSVHEIKPKTREERSNYLNKDKNTASSAYIKPLQEIINPKLATSLKEASKQHMKPRKYQSINDRQIFKRNVQTSQNQRNLNIRKRSIKHADKKEEHQNQNDIQKSNQCSPTRTAMSIQGLKKVKKASERSSATPYLDSKNLEFKQRDKIQGRSYNQMQKRQVFTQEKFVRSPKSPKSPKLLIEKQEVDRIDYLQKGISFKRKEKESTKQVQNINQKKIFAILNKKAKKQENLEHMNQAGSKEPQIVVRQTPRNFLLQSLQFPKDAKMRKIQNIDQAKSVNKEQKCIKQTKSSKIISFNSEDKYIRRILLALGWVLNPDTRSKYYHLKWVFKPSEEDYNLIREGQYINHIKNSHQLTSKHCLNKNLKAYFPSWTSLYDFYPQCYDISKSTQKQQFFEEYTKQFMMLLLRKIYTYLETIQFELIQQLRQKYQIFLQTDGSYSTDTKYMSFMRKKQFRNIQMENYKCFRADFTLHINLLTAALKYWRYLRKQQEFEAEEGYHFLNYNQKEFQNNMGYLERYSQMSTPTYITDSLQYFTKEFYSTPSNIVIERIVKEYVYFNRNYGKKWSVFGDGNIWIVKPCSASRGNGIYLQNNCKEILFNSKGIQSRIVQKYIERPLLFRSPNYPQICNRKFDIRQWVLLRSVDPLEIHMFSHCYVRICSQDYNIENINNLKSHLTNYSFNKQHFKNPSDSVLDYNIFKSMLMEEYKVDFEKQIREKIKNVIIKSIKSAQELLNDYGKRCFSLLGYDILLDQKFNPWLLEVNMSPACQQRTQWLKNCLKQMGKGMLQIVLPKQYISNQKDIDPLQNDILKQKQKKIAQKSKDNVQKSKDIVQLKRIKTEISHELLPPFQENKINLNFNQSKIIAQKWEDTNMQMEQLKQSESVVYDQEEQITYQDFIKQNMLTEEQHQYINDQQMLTTELVEKNETNQEKDQLQITKYQGDRMTQNIRNIRLESQISIPEQPTNLKTQPQQMQVQSDDCQEVNKQKIQNQFKWQLICFQEYLGKRKQIDAQIEIGGFRVTNEAIRSNDVRIDQFQEARDQLLQSIIKIQSKIKAFLKRKQVLKYEKKQEKVEQQQINQINNRESNQQNQQINKTNEYSVKQQKEPYKLQSQIKQQSLQQSKEKLKRSLKLNFSCMGKTKAQRKPRSRSVMEGEIDSIWHYSYVHTYREGGIQKIQVEKKETGHAKKSPKHKRLKNFYESKLRDKNVSVAVNAVADASVSYLHQIITKRNNKQSKEEQVKEQIKSEKSIHQEQEAENEIKQSFNQNYIE